LHRNNYLPPCRSLQGEKQLLKKNIFFLAGYCKCKSIFFDCQSNINQIDQPITANGAWFTRRLNKCDWMAISWYINIYQLMNTNIFSQKIRQIIFIRRKKIIWTVQIKDISWEYKTIVWISAKYRLFCQVLQRGCQDQEYF